MSDADLPPLMPHPEQAENRIKAGWSREEAESTPIRRIKRKDGSPVVAQFATVAMKTPSKVQRYVREGMTIEEAVRCVEN